MNRAEIRKATRTLLAKERLKRVADDNGIPLKHLRKQSLETKARIMNADRLDRIDAEAIRLAPIKRRKRRLTIAASIVGGFAALVFAVWVAKAVNG